VTPEHLREVERLFHEAREQPLEERDAWVARVCADDPALQREVESLLAQRSGGLIDSPVAALAAALVPSPAPRLAPGSSVGPYRIERLIDIGGMGEVYRAHDSKLHRDVALKVLPDAFANDPDRLARFTREAQTLAALNHPNIAHIHGFEETGGLHALVMELVEGEDLSQRIARGAIPIDEALAIARQIAEALEAAHEQGIIHRDLKPANIRLRRDGTVKVLDFGLAKALAPASDDGATLTIVPTRAGVILGTSAYMSPEQTRGEVAGRQADIWSFGVVLYEMLTGVSPFRRQTTAETVASVLGAQPDWSALRSATPATVRHLLRRCLEKNQQRRLQHMGDVRIEIEDGLTALTAEPISRPADAVPASGQLGRAAGVIALAGVAGVAGWWFGGHRPVVQRPAAVVRLSIPGVHAPRRQLYGTRDLAISEDGSRAAYASGGKLWIRPMSQEEGIAIEVVAFNPFFSPNGQWLGFFADGIGLAKVSVLGGTPVPIVMTSERSAGATWRPDGTIVYATTAGLYQVLESGGAPRLLVKPDAGRKERRYAWPQFMPDGRSVLFTIVSEESIEGAQIAVLNLKTGETKVVMKGGSAARYTSTGHLVYASGGKLKAIPFDPDTQQTRGEPMSFPDIEIANTPDNGAAQFAVSETGTLLFTAPTVPGQLLRTLSWVDRQGKEDPIAVAPGLYSVPRISPDGTRLALDVAGANRDIWILNLQRSSLTKLTGGPTEDMLPVWSRDGRRVFFASDRTGNFDVYSQAADGATKEHVEFAGPGSQMTLSFTPDGTRLLLLEDFKDISMLTLARPDRLEPLLHSEFTERIGEVSPDGNWIAYESNESGDRAEIFLRPFPNVSGQREKVSIDGGRFPLWGLKGTDELFYIDLNGAMMAASVKLSPSLTVGGVTKLFDCETPPGGPAPRPYDISPIDRRFLMTKPAIASSDGRNISVILNWLEELKPRVPSR